MICEAMAGTRERSAGCGRSCVGSWPSLWEFATSIRVVAHGKRFLRNTGTVRVSAAAGRPMSWSFSKGNRYHELVMRWFIVEYNLEVSLTTCSLPTQQINVSKSSEALQGSAV